MARMRVLVVSDTHGVIHPGILEQIAPCDLVVHAGDIGDYEVLQKLRRYHGRCLAVRGNNDTPAKWPQEQLVHLKNIPWELSVELPGGVLVVEHGHKRVPAKRRHALLRSEYASARAVVYGHSHQQVTDLKSQPWVLNPGAAGRSRTYGGSACLVLDAGPRRWHLNALRYPV